MKSYNITTFYEKIKNIQGIFYYSLSALLLILFILNGCSKDPVRKVEPNTISNFNAEIYREQIKPDLELHDKLMTDLLISGKAFGTSQELLGEVISQMMVYTKTNNEPENLSEIKSQLEDFIDIENLDLNSTFKNLHDKNIITDGEFETLLKINSEITSSEISETIELQNKLIDLENKLIINNNSLNNNEKGKLVQFMYTCQNSLNLYDSLLENSSSSLNKRSCGRCIKSNIWSILAMDGAGTIVGIAGCLLWPPSCVIILPACIAYGSGGAILIRCRRECF